MTKVARFFLVLRSSVSLVSCKRHLDHLCPFQTNVLDFALQLATKRDRLTRYTTQPIILAACLEVWKMERERFNQQFGERSGEAQTSKIVPKEQSWYEQDIPHEQLVETLRYFSERARINEYQQAREEWEPATWLEWELRCQAVAAYNATAYPTDLPLEELPMAMFFHELSIGWEAFAYHKLRLSKGELREIREDIQNYASVTHSETMTLHPKAIKLFDAMAEVSGIPRKRGEATIDLRPFVKRLK